MSIISICSTALITLILVLMLKKTSYEFSVIACICGGILILIPAFIRMTQLIDSIKNLSDRFGFSNSLLSLLIKSLSIALMTVFAGQTCQDSGEGALSQKVYFAGKLIIVSLVFPYIEIILEKVTDLI